MRGGRTVASWLWVVPSAEPRCRATSTAVGVALLVGVTVLLAATVGVAVGMHGATGATPQAHVTGTLSAADGYPDGQVLALTHEAGDALDPTAVALSITFARTGEHARLVGFPTRRLTAGNVRGPAVFDASYAGVDGAVDAANTDGAWTSGETVEVRIASGKYDVQPGERLQVRVVHEPTNGVVAELRVIAA